MSTYTQILYHIIFSTKNRERSLLAESRPELFKYIWGVIKNNRGHLYRINGIEDHIHILTSLHPTVALADLIKDIKVVSSKWLHEMRICPKFTHWQAGYGAFTVSFHEKDALIEYIKNQEEHHRKISYVDELKRILAECGLEWDERYLG